MNRASTPARATIASVRGELDRLADEFSQRMHVSRDHARTERSNQRRRATQPILWVLLLGYCTVLGFRLLH